jgi:hypothetical protein
VLEAISGGSPSELGRRVGRLVGEEKEDSDDHNIMHSLGLCQTQLLQIFGIASASPPNKKNRPMPPLCKRIYDLAVHEIEW